MKLEDIKDNEMSADEMLKIFIQTRPQLFDHIYKECSVIYHKEPLRPNSEQELYFLNEDLNIAKAIVYDYGTRANKIGEIIVASTR